MIYNLFLLLMDGWCILSIFPCQPLRAVGYPFDCPNTVCLIAFPNINQTPKQNYPNQLDRISWYPKENEPEVFLNTYPHTNLACNVMSALPNHLMTRSVTKTKASPPGKTFSPLKMSWTYCIHTHCFRTWYRCKIWASLKSYSPTLVSKSGYGFAGDCCLVTSVSYATQVSLFTIKFFTFDIKFEQAKLM